MEWIQLAQYKVQWRNFVNMVVNLQFPYKTENFLTNWVSIGNSIT